MSQPRLTRTVRFSAAHRHHRSDWSEERNRAVFGARAHPHRHGHNYRLDVMVEAAVDPETGFSTDIGTLDELLRERVVEPLDHQHLTHAVPEFRDGRQPTVENILIRLWPRIAGRLPPGSRLRQLRLDEEDTLHVDYAGEPE